MKHPPYTDTSHNIRLRIWCLTSCLVAALLWPRPVDAEPLNPGDTFPDLKAFSLGGSLPDTLRGKVVLVDFWASWCGPCKASFPALEGLYQKYRKAGLVVIGISVDEDAAAMQRFLEKHPVTFPIAHDQTHKLAARVEVASMPYSVLITEKGVVRWVQKGFHGAETERQLATEIERLLQHPKE